MGRRTTDPGKLFVEHQKIMLSLAHGYARISKVHMDDLQSAGHEAFMYAYKTWDKRRPFGTWYYHAANSRMLNTVTSQQTRRHPFTAQDFPQNDGGCSIEQYPCSKRDLPDERLLFEERMRKLSSEARDVVNIALNAPAELDQHLRDLRAAQVRAHVYRRLKEQGWSYYRIWSAFDELRQFCHALATA